MNHDYNMFLSVLDVTITTKNLTKNRSATKPVYPAQKHIIYVKIKKKFYEGDSIPWFSVFV